MNPEYCDLLPGGVQIRLAADRIEHSTAKGMRAETQRCGGAETQREAEGRGAAKQQAANTQHRAANIQRPRARRGETESLGTESWEEEEERCLVFGVQNRGDKVTRRGGDKGRRGQHPTVGGRPAEGAAGVMQLPREGQPAIRVHPWVPRSRSPMHAQRHQLGALLPPVPTDGSTACRAALEEVQSPRHILPNESHEEHHEKEMLKMPQMTLNVSVDDVKRLVFELPAEEFLSLAEAIEDRAETVGMMRLAETGFREWDDEGENIYDAES